LVDDSPYIRLTSRQVLVDSGFTVVEAGDGEAALRQARTCQPDLILLDVMLPNRGGESVLRALRQDPATASIPVIVMSSLPQSNADKLIQAGAAAYIEKSKLDLTHHSENLVRIVNAALRKIHSAEIPTLH